MLCSSYEYTDKIKQLFINNKGYGVTFHFELKVIFGVNLSLPTFSRKMSVISSQIKKPDYITFRNLIRNTQPEEDSQRTKCFSLKTKRMGLKWKKHALNQAWWRAGVEFLKRNVSALVRTNYHLIYSCVFIKHIVGIGIYNKIFNWRGEICCVWYFHLYRNIQSFRFIWIPIVPFWN